MIPYLLAVAGGYLIGQSFKDDETYASGGRIKSYEKVDGTDYELKIEVYYDKGGMNYFSGRPEERGYYASVSPVKIERRPNGITTEEYGAFSGIKTLVLRVARQSPKAEKEAEMLAQERIPELKNYVLGKMKDKGIIMAKGGETGAASMKIKLKDGVISVYHSDGSKLLNWKAKKGDWDKIWDRFNYLGHKSANIQDFRNWINENDKTRNLNNTSQEIGFNIFVDSHYDSSLTNEQNYKNYIEWLNKKSKGGQMESGGEVGAAEIKVELKNGKITISHKDGRKLYGWKANSGDWDEIWDRLYELSGSKMEDGGIMAEGGDIEEFSLWVIGDEPQKIKTGTSRAIKSYYTKNKYTEQFNEWKKKGYGIQQWPADATKEEVVRYNKSNRGSATSQEYAQGGVLEHGLREDDRILVERGRFAGIKNDKTGEKFIVDIEEGSRTPSRL